MTLLGIIFCAKFAPVFDLAAIQYNLQVDDQYQLRAHEKMEFLHRSIGKYRLNLPQYRQAENQEYQCICYLQSRIQSSNLAHLR